MRYSNTIAFASLSTIALAQVYGENHFGEFNPVPQNPEIPEGNAKHHNHYPGEEPPSEYPQHPPSGEGYELVEEMKGYDFFDHWDFYHYEDPTHGLVDYVDAKTAWRENLVGFTEDGNAFMRVDTTPKVQDLRKSIRLESKTNNITGGLLISSITKSPYGCGVWYAWWLTGQEVWPDQGEIDILEGVNEYTENQSSFHTARGCQLSTSSAYTGTVTLSAPLGYNCASAETNNEGCGIVDPQAPLGPEFNEKKGGVYAMLWNENGISTWFFPRQKVPKDIYADDPSPSKWGKPLAHLSSDNCDIGGDWAGNPTEWHKKGVSGQTESCANITGYDNANDYILNEGEAFENAVFEIEYVKLYQ